MAEAEGEEPDGGALRPEERLGAALRTAREQRGLSLRALAKRLFRAHSLGRVFCELRRFEDAIDCEERSLAIAREVGHRWGEARSLEVLGIALLQTQGVEAARGCWRQALKIFTGLGAPQADDLRARLTGTLDAP